MNFEKALEGKALEEREAAFVDLGPLAITVIVVMIIVFSALLPIVNSQLYGAGANQTNLSGAGLQLANQTQLFIILAFVFAPLAGIAIFVLAGGMR